MLHLGVVDPVGQMRVYEALPVPEGDFLPGRVVPWMADCLGQFLDRQQILHPCRTVGVVVPGILDIGKGEMVFSANFQWEGVPLLEHLRRTSLATFGISKMWWP